MVMATIDKNVAEFRLQDGRIFRIMRITPESKSNFKVYLWDTSKYVWVETDWLGKEGKRFYEDALATFVSLVPLG